VAEGRYTLTVVLRAGTASECTCSPIADFEIYSTTRGGCQAVASGKQAINTEAADGAGRGGVIPPIETRWQPGQSGNPKGRPKGAATSFERVLEQELDRQVDGDSTLGDDGRISRRRRIVRALLAAFDQRRRPQLPESEELIWSRRSDLNGRPAHYE
jgi:hypothetical protein